MRDVLFAKVGSKHTVKIKRDAKLLTLNVTTTKRGGGGSVSDTFLEFLGISFDKTLHVVKIAKKAQKYQLIKGDKLLQIDSKNITTQEEILKNIAKGKTSYLLFERRGFQFFIKVN